MSDYGHILGTGKRYIDMLDELISDAAKPAIQLLSSALDFIAIQEAQAKALDTQIEADIEALRHLISG